MMRTLGLLIVMAVATSGGGWGQPAQDYESLKDATDDIWYAELLHAAQLTAEQLEALSGMQVTWQAETALTPDVAAALAEVRDLVLAGTPPQEAYKALGERQQEVQRAQGALEEAARQLISELAGLLTKEQANALAWVSSRPTTSTGLSMCCPTPGRGPKPVGSSSRPRPPGICRPRAPERSQAPTRRPRP